MSRALRRHQKQKHLKKRIKTVELVHGACVELYPQIWAGRSVKCNCFFCGNPRRNHGNSKTSLTVQERKNLDG